MKSLLFPPVSTNRIYGLDILRALAILFVVFGHGRLLLPEAFAPLHQYLTVDGVSIFFVLSGFLIGGILIKILHHHPPQKKVLINFWMRRWFRTLPAYFVVLILLTILHLRFRPAFHFGDVKLYYIFSQNLFTPHPSFFTEAWSLSIEEWFYLLIPLGIFSLAKVTKISSGKSILILACTVLLAVTLFRFYRYQLGEITSFVDWDKGLRKQVFTRLDALMYGVIGAYIQFYFKSIWVARKKLFFALGVAGVILAKALSLSGHFSYGGLYLSVFSFSLISLSTLFLLPFLSELKTGKGVVFRSVTRISLISYSMYLLHLSVIQKWILAHVPWHVFQLPYGWQIAINYILFWLLTLFLSLLLYKLVELPFMNMRDKRWFKTLFTT